MDAFLSITSSRTFSQNVITIKNSVSPEVSPPRRNPPLSSEGAYLAKRFLTQ